MGGFSKRDMLTFLIIVETGVYNAGDDPRSILANFWIFAHVLPGCQSVHPVNTNSNGMSSPLAHCPGRFDHPFLFFSLHIVTISFAAPVTLYHNL